MKKVAIPSENGKVAAHFGRCPEYTIVKIDGNKIIEEKVVSNPGHKPGYLPRFLKEKGVECVITGGMGRKAQNLFDKEGIKVVIGVKGSIEEALQQYLNNELKSGENICEH